ncbi:MAG TPA: DUF1844 domain-containing protein [Candidatus Binatia bacterium]|jgi:hypothetical protein
MAEPGEKTEGKGFKVADRRRFSETGETRETEPGAEEPRASSEAPPHETAGERRSAPDEPLPEINFSTFVLSLSTQALMHLGEIANPLTGKAETDVPVAKQMIDIIGMLQEKSRGNLDAREQQLVEDVLYDLRMRYVEAVKKK